MALTRISGRNVTGTKDRGYQLLGALLSRFRIERSHVNAAVFRSARISQVEKMLSVRKENRQKMTVFLAGCVQHCDRSWNPARSGYAHQRPSGSNNNHIIATPRPTKDAVKLTDCLRKVPGEVDLLEPFQGIKSDEP